jgi:hypothetical protein
MLFGMRHSDPDPAQRLPRPPGAVPVPARQCLPDLPSHPDHHRQENDHARVREMNEQVPANPDRMNSELETITADGEEEAAGARFVPTGAITAALGIQPVYQAKPFGANPLAPMMSPLTKQCAPHAEARPTPRLATTGWKWFSDLDAVHMFGEPRFAER